MNTLSGMSTFKPITHPRQRQRPNGGITGQAKRCDWRCSLKEEQAIVVGAAVALHGVFMLYRERGIIHQVSRYFIL